MSGPGIVYADNETESQMSRLTKEGKKFTYKLAVIQQPLRARACGSGAKSSADRRPVDPPPIVELRVFESNQDDTNRKDVTMTVDSAFVLFASLEQARHVVHGKMHQDQNNHCVLTGCSAAGTAFLERPAVAGYFVFPDLSVRHEGQYRLSFSLFEEVRDPRNEDPCDDPPSAAHAAFVTHRLEVRSKPFTVYSAKKFPGLTESTVLSRMVAEQGCRVRIRRDVRQRRRDVKGGKDWDAYEDATAEARARMSKTPEGSRYAHVGSQHGHIDAAHRPRSSRRTSHPSLASSDSRRPSVQDMAQDYQQRTYGIAPHTPQSTYAPYGVTPAPSPLYSQPPYMQQHSAMSLPPQQYQQQSHHSAHQEYYGPAQGALPPPLTQPQHAFNAPPQHHRLSGDYQSHTPRESHRSSFSSEPRASFGQQEQYDRQKHSQPLYQQSNHAQRPLQGQASRQSSFGSSGGYAAAPAAPAEPIPHRLPPRQSFLDKLPPLNTTLMTTDQIIEPASPVSPLPLSPHRRSGQTAPDSNKRQFGQVFNEVHLKQPLRQGARPNGSISGSSHLRGPRPPADAEEPEPLSPRDELLMSYRRADGRKISRDLPVRI